MAAIDSIVDNSKVTMADKLKGTQLSQDGFMKLLLAQLKLQSPLSPFDSSTMMQQISQLTALSASQSLEQTIKNMSVEMGSSQVSAASQLVGKQVQVPSAQGILTSSSGLKGALMVPNGVENVVVEIKDLNNNLVQTLNVHANSSGFVDFNWDGLDKTNKPMAPGKYNITASAMLNGQNTGIATVGTFTVNSVTLDKSNHSMILNGDGFEGVAMDDVLRLL